MHQRRDPPEELDPSCAVFVEGQREYNLVALSRASGLVVEHSEGELNSDSRKGETSMRSISLIAIAGLCFGIAAAPRLAHAADVYYTTSFGVDPDVADILAFDRHGHLFGVTTTLNPSYVPSILYRLDPTTGAATRIAPLIGPTGHAHQALLRNAK